MVGKRGWLESLQTVSRVSSSASVDHNDDLKDSFEIGKLSEYNSALVYTISSGQRVLSPGFKYLQVHTLFKDTITLAVHPKCRIKDVCLCCCAYLKMTEGWVLGLASRTPSEGFGSDRPRHEYYFLDSNSKISKYGPKHWRFNYPWASHMEGRPFLVLHLRVRIYLMDAHIIKCPLVLQYYYLQLRENLLDHWSTPESVSEERCWKMASVAYEADSASEKQEEDNDVNKSLSFRPEKYFPLWVIDNRGLDYVRRNLRNIKGAESSRSKEDAIQDFCEQASSSPFALNCHLYGLRQYKADTVDNAFIGISPKWVDYFIGLEMSDIGDDGGRNLRRTLQWSDIVLLSFDKRKLKMTSKNDGCTCLYAHSEEKARYLFEFCRLVHQTVIRINHYLSSWREQMEPVKDSLLLHPEAVPTELLLLRQSPVSRVSSNSTSGVVSDKPNSDAERDFDWKYGNGGTEIQSSSESPKKTFEHEEEEVSEKSLNDEKKLELQDRGELPVPSPSTVAVDNTNKSHENSCIPLSVEVETALRKLSLIDGCSSTVNSACCSTDIKELCTFPKFSLIETAEDSRISDSHIFEGLDDHCPLNIHLGHQIPFDNHNLSSPGPSHSLVSDGELIEEELNLGLPILAGYPEFGESTCTDAGESQLGCPIESVEHASDVASTSLRLCSSNLKVSDRRLEESCKACHGWSENILEKSSCEVPLKRPPLYAEAIALNRNARSHTNTTKVHAKQRWKTVAGVSATAIDYTNAEHLQQFQYIQPQAKSEPRLDFQMLSRSASPPPALHLSMQQLPVTSGQPPLPHTAAASNKFQKQSRCMTRISRLSNPTGISRVQSMPAHPPPLIQVYDVGSSDPSVMLHHAQSLAVRPLSAENKQPPCYELAIQKLRKKRRSPNCMDYNVLLQQVKARQAQQTVETSNNTVVARSANQSAQPNSENFCRTTASAESVMNDYPFMSLLLQEHQQENIKQSTNARLQQSSESITRSNAQFSSEIASAVNDECISESPSSDVRNDIRQSLLNTPELNDIRSRRLFSSDLFDDNIFGDEEHYLQAADMYRASCFPDNSLFLRQYAPYIAEQQVAHTNWNRIPPPPPYPQSRSSAAPLEAPMVM